MHSTPTTNYRGDTQYTDYRGRLHRELGPAIIHLSGFESWWLRGQRHRTNGPAVTFPDGAVEYWVNGVELSAAEFDSRFAVLAQ
jgi:hypothetical protein